ECLRGGKVPAAATIGFGQIRKAAAVGVVARVAENILAGIGNDIDTFRDIIGLHLAGLQSSAAHGESVISSGIAEPGVHAHPTVMKVCDQGRIRKPLEQLLLKLRIARGQEQFTGRPCQFVAVSEIVAEVLDFLISTIEAVKGYGIGEELPTKPSLCQV